MNRRRIRISLAVLCVLALSLVLAAPALAGAGGGSSGFGGGGGRGGGAGLYLLFQVLFRLALLGHGIGALVITALILVWVLAFRVVPSAGRAASERRRGGRANRRQVAQRARRVELAAAEAAEDDPAFAPDRLLPAAARLFTQIQVAWSNNDRATLKRLVAPKLFAEWERRLDDFASRGWSNHVEVVGEPNVQYVGIDRGSNADKATVRLEATLRDYVTDAYANHIKRAGRLSETIKTREFWTLGRRPNGWMLLSIEQGAEGAHALQDEIVATPWADTQGLRDEALLEGAHQDAVPTGTEIAELADFSLDGDARATALDLSLVDGRFSPDVIEVGVRRAVAAWADGIDGDAGALNELAAPAAMQELLHPGDPSGSTRVVVRGPEVKQIRIAELRSAGVSATMTVEVTITGCRYIEDRGTAAVLSGNPSRPSTFRERWTFSLQDDEQQPWRIAAVDSAVAAR